MSSCSSWGLGWDVKRPATSVVGRFAILIGMNTSTQIDAADIINRLSAELSAMTTRAVLAESRLAALTPDDDEDGEDA